MGPATLHEIASWSFRAIFLLLAARAVELSAAFAAEVAVPITVMFGDAEIGQPLVWITEAGHPRAFVGPEILESLEPIVVARVLDSLQKSRDPDGSLPLSRLSDEGIEAEYSARELALRIFVPFELRLPGALSIAARRPPRDYARLIPPARTSAYINLRAANEYLSRGGMGERTGRQSAVVDFDGALRVLGAAIEGSATWRERSSDTHWRRDDVRLVKDFPADRNRLIVGDLNYPTSGFQSFEQAGGIMFARNFDLQPYRVSSSMAERTLTLTRRSDVDVLINGRLVRTVLLEPGRYNLRDLPLAAGANDVEVRITDEVGRREIIRFPFVFDTSLLAVGEHEFSYALGARSQETASGKEYKTHDPVLSAFHALGLTESLTLGANIQAAERHQVLGGEARVGTVFGTFRGDVAVSRSSFAPTDMAARLQYRFVEPAIPTSLNRNLLARFTWRGARFAPLGTTAPDNPVAFDTGISYGQRLGDNWYGNLGLSVQFNRAGRAESRAFDLGLNRRIGNELTLDVFGRWESQPGRSTENSLFVMVSWTPLQSRHRIAVRRDTAARSTQIDWSYAPAETIGNVQANVSAERRSPDNSTRVRADARYIDYRFEGQVWNDERYGGVRTAAQRASGLRLASALVFADGHMAISRPVSDGFLLVAPHPTLAGHEVHVNSTGTRPQAQADWFGPAVMPRVPSHFMHRIVIDVPELPDGYELGDQIFNIQTEYRGGAVIVAGTGATAAVEGILVDPGTRPIDLQIGAIISLEDVGRAHKPFFTDYDGRFHLTGLIPGRYELRLDTAPGVFVRFDVPEGIVGAYNLGTVVFPVERRQ